MPEQHLATGKAKLTRVNTSPRISVIIPVHNGAGTIAQCLAVVGTSDYPDYEIIVVDDGSCDETLGIVSGFPCRVIALPLNRGPASARNQGARTAKGELLFFLDSDVSVTSTTLTDVAASFASRPEISALFCSYQRETIPWNFFTDYKNLVHHYTHQTARGDAATFCGGFGAIRRKVFLAMGGFDENHRMLEDVELGYRLYQAGHKIFLNKTIQLTHHKRYSLLGLIKSDLFGRAIPWTRIMLRKRIIRNDLNTRVHNSLSVVVAFAFLLALPAAVLVSYGPAVATALLLSFLMLNHDFLGFVRREKGLVFTLQTIGMLWITYLYSGVGLLLGIGSFLAEGLCSKFRAKTGRCQP
jgi:GT2 family glycosyltransferase